MVGCQFGSLNLEAPPDDRVDPDPGPGSGESGSRSGPTNSKVSDKQQGDQISHLKRNLKTMGSIFHKTLVASDSMLHYLLMRQKVLINLHKKLKHVTAT